MAKKPAPAESDLSSQATGPDGIDGPVGDPGVIIEVPQDVIDALGGAPIPAPQIRPPRPTVTRVGTQLPGRPDPGGLLANPRPDRREAVKRIDEARASIGKLVKAIEDQLATTGAKIGAAIKDAEACEAEGFDAVAANALIEDLAAALGKHLG